MNYSGYLFIGLFIAFSIYINVKHYQSRAAMTPEEQKQDDIEGADEGRIW